MEKVSIIIPMYNASKYINDTINSILNQTYKLFELIIVDDGSTDDSLKIVKRFKDKRIKILTQKNQGAPKARNNGLVNASGKYIYFFDSDDIMINNAVELLVDALESGYDVACGNYNYIDEFGNLVKNNEIKKRECKIYKGNEIYKSFPYVSIFPNNKLFRKDIIDKYNIVFDNVKIGQDLNFYYKYLLHCSNAIQLYESVCNYRLSSNSISRTYSKKIFDLANSFELVRQHYVKYSEEKKYNDYFGLHEKIQYCGQMLKIRYFVDYKDRKEIFAFFNKLIKKAKYNKNFIFMKFIQISIVVLISRLTISPFFFNFRKKVLKI